MMTSPVPNSLTASLSQGKLCAHQHWGIKFLTFHNLNFAKSRIGTLRKSVGTSSNSRPVSRRNSLELAKSTLTTTQTALISTTSQGLPWTNTTFADTKFSTPTPTRPCFYLCTDLQTLQRSESTTRKRRVTTRLRSTRTRHSSWMFRAIPPCSSS